MLPANPQGSCEEFAASRKEGTTMLL